MEEKHYFIHEGGFTFVEGNYLGIPDIADNLGTTFEDYEQGKYVLLSEEQTAFLEDNNEATPEEAWNMVIGANATFIDIAVLIDKIRDYDTSDKVNVFYVNEEPVWFNKDIRVSLSNSISIEKEIGKETTTLWMNGTPYTIAVEDAQKMLTDIELYAIECYNTTQTNIAKAKKLTLKSEINEFDITKGYPEKLSFNL